MQLNSSSGRKNQSGWKCLQKGPDRGDKVPIKRAVIFRRKGGGMKKGGLGRKNHTCLVVGTQGNNLPYEPREKKIQGGGEGKEKQKGIRRKETRKRWFLAKRGGTNNSANLLSFEHLNLPTHKRQRDRMVGKRGEGGCGRRENRRNWKGSRAMLKESKH